MGNSKQLLKDAAVQNDRSLNTLKRAIALSQGQFSLVLANCNYGRLRSQILQRLRELSSFNIREIVLPELTTRIYPIIQAELGDTRPSALMIFGLESVSAIESLLTSSNQMRDELRQSFPFPLVLWINDKLQQKLIKFAPDLTSWAATPIKFVIATDELIDSLRQNADSLFASILESDAVNCLNNSALDLEIGSSRRLELDFAQTDLLHRGIKLDPELEASLEFVFGRDAYANDIIDVALDCYQRSLAFWQQVNTDFVLRIPDVNNHLNDPKSKIQNPKLKEGLLLFHIGLCYRRKADLEPAKSRRHWEEARKYLQQCVNVFEELERPDLVAKFIGHLGEVLRRMEDWDNLQNLANKSLQLHITYGNTDFSSEILQLAQDYVFLAEVALKRQNWEGALYLATLAKTTLSDVGKYPQHENLALLLLGIAQQQLGQIESAISNLEMARSASNAHYDPRQYIRILKTLRSVYFQQSQYREAFQIKLEQRSIEQQYGFRAFIGAGQLEPQRQATNPALVNIDRTGANAGYQGTVALEIATSGRQQDVYRLIERISRNDQKLTVIYGQSGVGKSSIVNAGLVPALKQTSFGARDALPVVLQVYTDWSETLGRGLAQALKEIKNIRLNYPLYTPQLILAQLQKNQERNLLTVLIFDQFEEFFFVGSNSSEIKHFFDFLRYSLNLPFVKVILSIREDHLHRLLGCQRLTNLPIINNDILSKDILHYIGNFSPADAKALIQSLTQRSQFYLEEALIDELVRDLAADFGEVRPIELQVVGAQLQAENITTLSKYQERGPKNRLVEQFLQEVIHDCGPENEQVALLVLYLLTDENGTRPIKTRAELASNLEALEEPNNLDLVLWILVKSGLVFQLPEFPAQRYQLIHDYLVTFIRYLQQQELGLLEQVEEQREELIRRQTEIVQLRQEKELLAEIADVRYQFLNDYLQTLTRHSEKQGLLAELTDLRHREELSQVVIEQLRQEKELLAALADAKEKQKRSEAWRKRIQTGSLAAACGAVFILTGLVFSVNSQKKLAQISQIKAISASSEALVASNREFDALIESLRAVKQLKSISTTEAEIHIPVVTALGQAVYGVREYNRLEGHTNNVLGVVFSPDGKIIATASDDKTVILWRRDGSSIATLTGHKAGVAAVSFSPDGQTLATASADNTVKLWHRDGTLLRTLEGHTNDVTCVTWSPDGQTVATGSADNTVKLWRIDGRLIRTFKGHTDWVLGVSFSPDGQTIVSGSVDKTIKLWRLDGKLINTLTGHRDAVQNVAFSPDGKLIASASEDKTVKLWRLDGTTIATLTGHKDLVLDVSFNPQGDVIASASADKTIKLWQRDGTLIKTLSGHGNGVRAVAWSPDGGTLATASDDNTVKLWRIDNKLLKRLTGHQDWVNSVSFSPDGQILASASSDATVKLWRRDGKLLKTLTGHSNWILDVSFSPDGETLATASEDTTIKLWRRDGTLLNTLKGHDKSVTSVTFSPDGQTIASSSEDKTVKLWRRDGTLLQTLNLNVNGIWGVRFSPDGQIIASATKDGTVKLWSRNGKEIATLKGHNGSVNWVNFSPDGQIIATASDDKTVKLWTRNGAFIDTLKGHSGSVNWVSFSPDGKTIASASDDNTVILWNFNTREPNILKGHKGKVLSVNFSPDGKTIASASEDKQVILWNLDLEYLQVRGCNWVRDYLKTNINVRESDRNLCEN
ncbi:hypothetical protein H6S82_09765 [Planktothrix sp. FACHB-1355]|uniref:Novel STAND NTPase 1 domain-containing protein n=1 Tax=Aerosakkonema funiforme FACHB-1375 TaxID=2949571 RepID=A0A926VJJ6_9CYAN|nr:hypothetical protein [Aerosakkonema funiforme]MBD2185080.1 hypothetical protein [Aerosakkonema funiforme FACHB-1375]MBD3559145.1 hypothetical protein [Planktothrix sp. FACHB-1355]